MSDPDAEVAAAAQGIMERIIAKFPEARAELRNLIVCLDRGEALSLAGVTDLQSRLELLRIFKALRLRATRTDGGDIKYDLQPTSVRQLRQRFRTTLQLSEADLQGASDSEGSDSASSSSSSSSSRKKKSKKSKKSKKDKKSKKKKKDKKDKKRKKEKKEKKTAAPSTAEDAPAAPAGPTMPDPAHAPAKVPGAGKDDDDDDDFGPAVSYRDKVGDGGVDDAEATRLTPRDPTEKPSDHDDMSWMKEAPKFWGSRQQAGEKRKAGGGEAEEQLSLLEVHRRKKEKGEEEPDEKKPKESAYSRKTFNYERDFQQAGGGGNSKRGKSLLQSLIDNADSD